MATSEQRERYLLSLIRMAYEEAPAASSAELLSIARDYGASVVPQITEQELRSALRRSGGPPAPGTGSLPENDGVLLTGRQLRAWASLGRDLSVGEVRGVAALIPCSPIPAAIGGIVRDTMKRTLSREDQPGLSDARRRTCSCGEAQADEPGHDEELESCL